MDRTAHEAAARRGGSTPRPLSACLLAVVVLLSAGAPRARADAPVSRGYALKAALIYNFFQFVEWPDAAFPGNDPHAPFVIGVLGEDPFKGTMEKIVADRLVRGRPVRVRHAATPDDLAGCHVVFVPEAEQARTASVVERLARAPALTVGETDRFCAAGGAIRLFTEDNRVRLEISPTAARRAGLTVSSRLLKAAKIYE